MVKQTPEPCSDCGRDTFPDDAAPSCGAHILCVSCFTTSDFRCRECRRVADGLEWFSELRAVPAAPFPPYVEPEPPAPLDLTADSGVFTVEISTSLRFCNHCPKGIHVGREVVYHRPSPDARVDRVFHRECVILP